MPDLADLFKVEAEAESSHIISVAAATTEDDDEAVSSLKRHKKLTSDDDSGSSASSLHMYEDPADDLVDTTAGDKAADSPAAGSPSPSNREEPVLLGS